MNGTAGQESMLLSLTSTCIVKTHVVFLLEANCHALTTQPYSYDTPPPPNTLRVGPYPTSAKRRGCARQSTLAPTHPASVTAVANARRLPVSFVHADLTPSPPTADTSTHAPATAPNPRMRALPCAVSRSSFSRRSWPAQMSRAPVI